MKRDVPLMQQTVYAELLDRCLAAAFDEAFPEDGTFVSKEVRSRKYWYFQEARTKKQRYVGPETPELLDRIARHRQSRDSERERRALVSTLVRSAHLPGPLPALGDTLAGLAKAGVFRLRGVLVGTVAFQTYSASIGVRLPRSAMETLDVDIAQDRNISIAVKDSVRGLLDALREADASFHPVPPRPGSEGASSYQTGRGDIRVEFLTPNRGRDSDAAVPLPALGTYAQQLRFLDYLIRDPQHAVVLHGSGILVQVPTPERYCLHKLIIARRRSTVSAKIGKDLEQAEALLAVLARARPRELRDAWDEAAARGTKWRRLLLEGLSQINPDVRDETLKAVGLTRRSMGLDITFDARRERYDRDREVVTFVGSAGGHPVRCDISREAIEDCLKKESLNADECLHAYRKERKRFHCMMSTKYLECSVEEPGRVLLRSEDVEKLRQRLNIPIIRSALEGTN